ncbi:DUF1232 domain-containing protein [Candidatus Poribacteria bacterium]|nr:DUF1232 domain-containing protein [Candidatus Poribacteria bacterium]
MFGPPGGSGAPKWLRHLYHLPNYGRLVVRLWRDPRVPIYRKGIPAIFAIISACVGMVYFLAKVDLIPDFFPFIGSADDLAVLLVLVFAPGAWLFIRLAPRDILEEHVREINESSRRGPMW